MTRVMVLGKAVIVVVLGCTAASLVCPQLARSGVEAAQRSISGAALLERIQRKAPPLILDVRSPQEFSAGHVPGALNIPHTDLEARLDQIGSHRQQEIVVYCRSGRRASMAEQVLRGHGFEQVLHLEGDMEAWAEKDYPVERSAPRK